MAKHLVRIIAANLYTWHLKPTFPLHLRKSIILPSRLLHKNVELSDHTCEISNYEEYRANHKPFIHIIMQTLKEILDITTLEINQILVANPQLKKRSRASVLNNYYNLLDSGIQKSTIINNVWLLAHENGKLKEKLNRISALHMNNNELVPWLRLTQEELANFVIYSQSDMDYYTYNKLEHLAHRLQCNVQELCVLTIRCSFLLKIPVSFIDKKLNIFHEYNICNRNILNDLWIFRYSENHIRHRCELYKDTQSLEIKTWAIRCPLRIIIRAIQRNHVARDLMQNHKNISDYLINKLNVNEKTLKIATIKWPGILRVNPVKLDQLINILQKSGIDGNDILQHGQIFYFNVETLQKRIEILKNENLVPKITLLTVSKKLFEKCIRKAHLERELWQNHKNIKEYLIKKLSIDEKTLEDATIRWPHILRVNILKLDQLITLLHESDITSDQIMKHGRVFNFSLETLRIRIETMKKIGLVPKITVITYAQKSFDQYLQLHKY